MSGKSSIYNTTVLLYRPTIMQADPNIASAQTPPQYDVFYNCRILNWGVGYIALVTLKDGKASKVISTLAFTLIEDVDLHEEPIPTMYSSEGCTCADTDGKKCPIPFHQPAK